jgi:orotidine-5'-phosphate decarboxylase
MQRVILPLDVSTIDEVKRLVEPLAAHVACFKIGLELISAGLHVEAIRTVAALGGQSFLDIKLHDIPNTVGAAARNAALLGVYMFNVHISAGAAAMQAAVENAGGTKVFGVSVLTSLNEEDCDHIYGSGVEEMVRIFAKDAKLAGLAGLICSPKELSILRSSGEFEGLQTVIPGVRPIWAESNDQKRVLTPAEAIRAGADYLVIGRPITKPPKEIGTPLDAIRKINAEIDESSVLSGRAR